MYTVKLNMLLRVLLLIFTAMPSFYVVAEESELKNWTRQERMVDPYSSGEEIIDSMTAGQWHDSASQGQYRFVITRYKEGRERFYIQWLNTSGEVAYSLSIKELNKRPNFDLNLPKCMEFESCQTLSVDAEHYYEKTKQRFVLKLGSVGVYSFHP